VPGVTPQDSEYRDLGHPTKLLTAFFWLSIADNSVNYSR
jgi:hypothetical protein